MKCFLLLTCLVAAPILLSAQTDLTGTYGYSFAPQGNPPATEKRNGPKGNLVLIKMEGNKYRFWLDVTMGWPSYHVGETDGTIEFKKDTASFDNTFEDASSPCVLSFKIIGTTIRIDSHSSSFNCGFGQGVNADGEYARLVQQPVLDNSWLEKEYYSSARFGIKGNRAELFQDENCLVAFSPRRYLSPNIRYLDISATQHTIYTECIPAPGKFVWGWVKRTEVITGQ